MSLSNENTLSIGEVLSLLKKDFPDVSISKIRFLETEGLITPARSTSGYRRFDTHDVSRLRAVLTLQRDQYLPLKVIKDQLEAETESAGIAVPVSGSGGVRPDDFRPGSGRVRLTRSELAQETGLDEAIVVALEKDGLVLANPAGHFDEDAVQICTIAHKLAAFGVEPRHLRSFRVVANRESGLVEQIATPFSHPRDRDSKARAQQTVRELASLFVQLHAALLRAELIRSGSG
ncbi:MAG: MerR family transcriptional regulator [Candidatus Nanopelagicales bacterium]|nr:MerR family transcriptional regulator [Candidatus Nanopelagicales bacterium]MCF8538722.1 MerR family transcriptional regulator [Candidatus Nanopelagicales bacterium]MCF8551634.1 MerR family transcriptional regulator [Candidatus Nanopelagicales bacterium]